MKNQNKIVMLSDIPSNNYPSRKEQQKDMLARKKNIQNSLYNARVRDWLKSRPEVGALNSGVFYIMNQKNEYVEIEVFS